MEINQSHSEPSIDSQKDFRMQQFQTHDANVETTTSYLTCDTKAGKIEIIVPNIPPTFHLR